MVFVFVCVCGVILVVSGCLWLCLLTRVFVWRHCLCWIVCGCACVYVWDSVFCGCRGVMILFVCVCCLWLPEMLCAFVFGVRCDPVSGCVSV